MPIRSVSPGAMSKTTRAATQSRERLEDERVGREQRRGVLHRRAESVEPPASERLANREDV